MPSGNHIPGQDCHAEVGKDEQRCLQAQLAVLAAGYGRGLAEDEAHHRETAGEFQKEEVLIRQTPGSDSIERFQLEIWHEKSLKF